MAGPGLITTKRLFTSALCIETHFAKNFQDNVNIQWFPNWRIFSQVAHLLTQTEARRCLDDENIVRELDGEAHVNRAQARGLG